MLRYDDSIRSSRDSGHKTPKDYVGIARGSSGSVGITYGMEAGRCGFRAESALDPALVDFFVR